MFRLGKTLCTRKLKFCSDMSVRAPEKLTCDVVKLSLRFIGLHVYGCPPFTWCHFVFVNKIVLHKCLSALSYVDVKDILVRFFMVLSLIMRMCITGGHWGDRKSVV